MDVVISGFFYDGSDSRQHAVELRVDSNGEVFIGDQSTQRCHFNELAVSPRIGNTARHIGLPDGSRFETRDNDGVDLLYARWQSDRQGLPHKLESNLKLVFLSVVSLIGIGYLTVVFGIPALSKQITDWLPLSIDEQLAEHSLEQLDSVVFTPSKLEETRQQEIEQLFNSLLPPSERTYTLLFRDGGGIGANAFALPDGHIVITDQLIALPESDENEGEEEGNESNKSVINDEMIASVLLHEIGHVEYRHSLQNVVRQAGVSALIVAVTGDVTAASSLVLLLPTLLVQSQYSQEFEWEADTYALEQMLERGMDPTSFATMMASMTNQKRQGDEEPNETEVDSQQIEEGSFLDYFASHPASKKRIERFRAAAKKLPDPQQP